MVETDPVYEIEVRVADAIADVLLDVTGRPPEDVQVHFRESTVVYVADCDHMPALSDHDAITAINEGIAGAVVETLGRRLAVPPFRTRLSPRSVLVVLRLG